MISEETWYLKGCENPDIYVDKVYNCERTTGSIYNATSLTTWTGKIALPYPSDYGYATDLNLCKKTLYNYNDSTCINNNWMKAIIAPNNGWLLTPYSRNFFNVWFVKSVGNLLNNVYTYNLLGVTPTLYLDSKIKIKESTTGSSTNPFQIVIE